MLSIDTDSPEGLEAFDIVTECEDANYPDGNLFDAWQKLKTNSEPTTVCAFVDLKNDFNARGLREKEKPLTWITELEKMRNRLKEMKHPVNDEDFFIHIIGHLPRDYRYEKKIFNQFHL